MSKFAQRIDIDCVTGLINSNGELIPNSAHGNLTFNVSQGALRNFEPIMKIGKFAFPFRDVENITFSDLSGQLNMRGEQIDVNDLTGSLGADNGHDVGKALDLTALIEIARPLVLRCVIQPAMDHVAATALIDMRAA